MTRKGRKRKVYDDRALALALAHQTKTTTQIAREFGLSQSYVIQLRKGRFRPEIQALVRAIHRQADVELENQTRLQVRALLAAHIRAAMTGTRGVARKCREYLLDRFLPPETEENVLGDIQEGSPAARGVPIAAREGPTGPRGGRYRKKFYDEGALVRDLAEGRLSIRRIARKHKLSRQFVGCIRQGSERPDLTPRIDAIRQAIWEEGSRMMTPWIKLLLAKEAHVGITENHDTARMCRHYMLDRFLPHDGSNCPWQRKKLGRRRNARRWRRRRS